MKCFTQGNNSKTQSHCSVYLLLVNTQNLLAIKIPLQVFFGIAVTKMFSGIITCRYN